MPRDDSPPPLLLVLRIVENRCTLSLDSSGEPLHRRGWRLATAKAPLRPTLAAAALLSAGWDGRQALADPFCGSGTICIEAARIARRLPPVDGRRFAFERWPSFEPGTWASVVGEAGAAARPCPVPIVGRDRDAGAVEAASTNAARAGVIDDLDLACAPVSAFAAPAGEGSIVTNPPWGGRLDGGDLRNLYARLGKVASDAGDSWDLTVVCSDARLANHTGARLAEKIRSEQGGQRVLVLSTR